MGEVLGPIEAGIFGSNVGTYKWEPKLNSYLQGQFNILVDRELEAAGYPVAKKQEDIFETGNKPEDNSLEMGVMVRGMKLHMGFIGRFRNGKGEVSLDVKWALFDPKRQKVVFELPVSGSFQTGSNTMPLDDVISQGVIAVTRKLLADPTFVAALEAPPEPAASPAADTPAYSITNTAPPKGGVAKNNTLLRSAVVTLETSSHSGSGFYISQEGYLLTNHHVVGDSKFVKVRTATGRELPGEVLGFDSNRDVALVKTQKTSFDPLALRLTDPEVGEEVFAIGSPLSDQFNGTVTRGVLSGFRDSGKKRFLQSDVSILPGNSGGPLVDANGAVIGIAVYLGVVKGGNMNFFIPIADALAQLSIKVNPPVPEPVPTASAAVKPPVVAKGAKKK
ncbi:MAG: trypsin-like peptidase domain-containing protein [Holophaga sp.]|nr:trypsin-like peptidase domain-containing protein [Holophaga sp.]